MPPVRAVLMFSVLIINQLKMIISDPTKLRYQLPRMLRMYVDYVPYVLAILELKNLFLKSTLMDQSCFVLANRQLLNQFFRTLTYCTTEIIIV